jgi:hypothetical protein
MYRGFTNKKSVHTIPISVRWTDADRAFVDRQAGVLGISFSEFVRWSSYFMAVEINKLEMMESFRLRQSEAQPKKKVDIAEYE